MQRWVTIGEMPDGKIEERRSREDLSDCGVVVVAGLTPPRNVFSYPGKAVGFGGRVP